MLHFQCINRTDKKLHHCSSRHISCQIAWSLCYLTHSITNDQRILEIKSEETRNTNFLFETISFSNAVQFTAFSSFSLATSITSTNNSFAMYFFMEDIVICIQRLIHFRFKSCLETRNAVLECLFSLQQKRCVFFKGFDGSGFVVRKFC